MAVLLGENKLAVKFPLTQIDETGVELLQQAAESTLGFHITGLSLNNSVFVNSVHLQTLEVLEEKLTQQ